MHSAGWIIFTPFFFFSVFLSVDPILILYQSLFCWGFAVGTPNGIILNWSNCAWNGVCSILEMAFNILSLRWVHKTRNQIQSISAADNRRREIMLLIQSFVVGFFFTMANILFSFFIGFEITYPMADLVMQCVWMFNHCNNPIVYLTVNGKLRRAFLKFITCGMYGKPKQIHTATISAPGGPMNSSQGRSRGAGRRT